MVHGPGPLASSLELRVGLPHTEASKVMPTDLHVFFKTNATRDEDRASRRVHVDVELNDTIGVC